MTRHSTLLIALAGSLLMWAAQPPFALGWLGWVAPVPWLLLVRRNELAGRRPYLALWFAALAFWLAAIHWLRLPHPAVYLGWFALSAYLAVYLPVFVGLSRVAVHQLKVPLWLAAPVVWTGLELARAHVMTGFMMASLAHTQAAWPAVIQISDLVGEYGVDFVMILTAASVTSIIFPPRRPLAIVPAILILSTAIGYGRLRLSETNEQTDPPRTVRIALIQGNSLADWKSDEAKQQQIMQEYIQLSQQAIAKSSAQDGRRVDLIVWPETMFRSPLRKFEPGFQLPPSIRQTTDELAAVGPGHLATLATQLDTPVLVGVDRVIFLADEMSATETPNYRAYNCVALVDRGGNILGTYDKVHLVMFGEYVPFSGWLPILKQLSPLTGTAEAGAGPVALCIDNVCYAPSVCYETVIPHVIRTQVATLQKRGQDSFSRSDAKRPVLNSEKRVLTPFSGADVLVNLTNDAWYWGSSELDMHLACDVFRAVETRKPLVVAANGGISAWIDRFGRIRAQSPRLQPDVILADVELNRNAPPTVYARTGDWFAGLCLTCCIILAIIGWRLRRVSK